MAEIYAVCDVVTLGIMAVPSERIEPDAKIAARNAKVVDLSAGNSEHPEPRFQRRTHTGQFKRDLRPVLERIRIVNDIQQSGRFFDPEVQDILGCVGGISRTIGHLNTKGMCSIRQLRTEGCKCGLLVPT